MVDRVRFIPYFMILAISVALMATDLYLPAMPMMVELLDTTDNLIQNSIAAYYIGLMLSAPIYGPLSDAYGRRRILLIGFGLFLISSILLVFTDNIYQLLTLRALQGLGGGVSAALSPAVIRDRFTEKESNKILSQMMMFILLTPAAAPIVGGYLTTFVGWRSCFVFIALSVLASFLLFLKFFPETHPVENRSEFRLKPLLNAYKTVLSNRSFLSYILVHSLPSAGMFCCITTTPFVFIRHMGVPTEYFGFYVFGQIMVVTVTSFFVQRIINSKDSIWMMTRGQAVYLLGAFGSMTAATFLSHSVEAAILMTLPYFMANTFVFPTSMTKAMSFSGHAKGAAAACIATSRQFFAFLGSFVAALLPDSSLLPTSIFMIAVALTGCVCLVLAYRWEKALANEAPA